MEWATVQHFDLRHADRSSKPLQPHAAAFHSTQAIVSAAIDTGIVEFDAYTGSKIASVDIGSPVVRMAYNPIGGHSLIAILEQMLELLLSKAPPGKQDELRSLIDICIRRGLSNKSIDPLEDPSQFCAATMSRLSTIGYDVCDLCGAKFSALSSPGCIICVMGSIKRSDALSGPVPSPFD